MEVVLGISVFLNCLAIPLAIASWLRPPRIVRVVPGGPTNVVTAANDRQAALTELPIYERDDSESINEVTRAIQEKRTVGDFDTDGIVADHKGHPEWLTS
jgi:hypothetical protein